MWMRGECPVQWSNVFLTGLMGSGKTTVGKMLADGLGWTHLDTDQIITKRTGKTIREIFESGGEAAFRREEETLMREISARRFQVVSLGGGTLSSLGMFQMVSYAGVLVYLKTNLITLVNRLMEVGSTQKDQRPLLAGIPNEVLWQRKLRELFEQRRFYFEEADFEVATDFLNASQVAAEILEHLPRFVKQARPAEERSTC